MGLPETADPALTDIGNYDERKDNPMKKTARIAFITCVCVAVFVPSLYAELIKCQDCTKMVSTQATACPHCGCPVPVNPNIADATNRIVTTRQNPVAFDSVRNGIVFVRTKQSSGSGFIVEINNKKYLITNIHVLRDLKDLTIKTLAGENLAWSSIELSDTQDIARLLLKEPNNVKPIPVSTNSVIMNQPVVVYGNSEGRGRFGVKFADGKWVLVQESALKKQVSLLEDIDRFVGDAFSILSIWAFPGITAAQLSVETKGKYESMAASKFASYSAKKEVEYNT